MAQAFFSGFSPPLLLPLSFPFPPPLLLPLKSRRREGVRGAPQGEKKEGVVARALSLSHTCGHTGRARTVLDWVVLR